MRAQAFLAFWDFLSSRGALGAGTGCTGQRRCVTRVLPLQLPTWAGQDGAQHPGTHGEISWCQHRPLAKAKCQSALMLPALPVLPSSWERHSLLIGLGTPSGNGNVLTYYSLMSLAETKHACLKLAPYVSKMMLEVACVHVSGVAPTMFLRADFPALNLA